MARKIRYTRILGATESIVREMGELQFSDFQFASTDWLPNVNVFRYRDRFEVVADLAGVAREEIDLTAMPGCLILQGIRKTSRPDCPDGTEGCRETLAMEIPSGPFSRRVEFPQPIDPNAVIAKQEGGLLRIVLPLASV